MKVTVLRVTGFEEALIGIGLSYGLTSPFSFNGPYDFRDSVPRETQEKLEKIAKSLSKLDGGEDKFLRQLTVSMDVTASLYWWKQADTYKVGTVAQSESTMHTLMHNEITQACFEHPIFPDTLKHLEGLRQTKEFEQLVNELPCGWLQRRIWTMNYAVLKNIINKRSNHKLKEWRYFCKEMLEQLPLVWLLPFKNVSENEE